MNLATDKHIDTITDQLQALGYEGVRVDTSYGFVTGVSWRLPVGGEMAVTTRSLDNDHRGRAMPVADWIRSVTAYRVKA